MGRVVSDCVHRVVFYFAMCGRWQFSPILIVLKGESTRDMALEICTDFRDPLVDSRALECCCEQALNSNLAMRPLPNEIQPSGKWEWKFSEATLSKMLVKKIGLK